MTVDVGSARGRIEIDASGVELGVKKAQSAMGGFSGKAVVAMAGVGLAVKGIGQALDGMARVAGRAWDAIEEGAALDAARGRFDRLAQSIDTTSDSLLNRLRSATNGMMTDAQLISSATDIMSLGLGKTEDQTVRLASVVGKLGWDMQQVVLTMANNSKMRLDALGLSVEDVDARVAKLRESGMSLDEAFDLAVIEAGEAKITLLGDASQTTAGKIAQLKTAVENAGDAFAKAFSGEVVRQIDAIGESTEQLGKDLEYAATGAGTLAGALTKPFFNVAVGLGKMEEVRALGQEYQRLGGDLAELQRRYQGLFSGRLRPAEAEAAVAQLQAEVEALQHAAARREAYNRTLEAGTEIEQNLADAADRRQRAELRQEDEQAAAQARAARILQEFGHATEEVDRKLLSYAHRGDQAAAANRRIAEETGYTVYELAQMGKTAEQVMEETAAATEEAAARAHAAFAAVQGDYVTQLPGAEEPLVMPERTVTTRTMVSGPTAEQASLAAKYRTELEKLRDTYQELTGGIGTFGVEQDKLDAAIAATAGEIAHYEGLLAGIPPTVEEVSTAHQGLKVNVDAVHQGIYDQLVQMGAAPDIIAAYAAAVGIMTDAQAEAALQAAAVQLKIEELAAKIAEGMPIDAALADLDAFIAKIEQGVNPAAQTLATDVPARVTEMKDAMSEEAMLAGQAVPEGVAQGIADSLETATTASTDAATAVIDAAKARFGVASPSTEFAAIGGDLMVGLSEGAVDEQGQVVGTMRRIGDAALRAWDSTVSAAHNIGVAIMDGVIAGVESKRAELIAKMEEIAREAYQRAMSAIGAASPSRLFMHMGEAIITGVVAGLNAEEDKLYDKLLDIAARLQQIGEGMFTFQADALAVDIAGVDEQLAASLNELRSAYGDIMIDNLLAMSPSERAYFLRTLRGWGPGQNQVVAEQLQAAVVLADRRNALEQEYVRQQEELAKLEEQRSRLNFLQMQVDLLKVIRDNGLSTDILEGLTLGLDANISDVIAAMTEAVRQLIDKTSEELEIASPSGVFERIGGQIMAGLERGVTRAAGGPVGALADAYDEMGALGRRMSLAGLGGNDLAAQWLGGVGRAKAAADLRQQVTIYGGYNVNLEGATSTDPLRDLYWGGLTR